MAVDFGQVRRLIITPINEHLGLGGAVADMLVFGTGVQESRFRYIHQLGGGPARGPWQMEPRTHDDIHANFLAFKKPLREKVMALTAPVPALVDQLHGNWNYAAAMCRIHYFRRPEPLPKDADDLEALGKYYKRWYNTPLGKGTVEEFVRNLNDALGEGR